MEMKRKNMYGIYTKIENYERHIKIIRRENYRADL